MSKREFNFKQSKGARKFLTWAKWLEGDYLIGTFKQQLTDQFGNPSYTVEVIETSLEKVEEGDLFGLNSNGALNYKMGDVEVGSVIRVEYEGEDILDNPKSPFNGRKYHKVDLQIDESSAVNVEEIKAVQDEENEFGEYL